ncbi:MAG TPA: tRNA uridine(34) 5-carboxymethylaminomethyl modification radical SAM/GNAT enzyme Elp3 [Methanoregulaceae archaeon]|nr:MAG: tRNA uridine(34) 5-carboxymethylaminomethyl modification radical SAM/GNAT enzyme Elp3 [Methanolinea sp.]HON80975.1 tRNA uridine(34) 5-carboxymethylaminomethyl modification radical SAM/GNAT enzyme Elp3 [Methanoregulaceae archaeon]HPD09718.1 tRNA uridine(34) 5-carboxymethylaminomethyl modification radical SAM/GNAT enzyme Elp3 [Methanoregulaceae archaeon]HRT14561.1 tRNA uridine(34) 5-carboxymethylaminomethyl modification radical SAM/GNAT enzyme Elp3 [Methanoregulaceae archaeon]HRU30132.1 t
MAGPDVHREIIDQLLSRDIPPSDVTRVKVEVCGKHGLPTIPRNSDLLAAALPGERDRLRTVLLVKPTRTLSGVAPVAVMTSPFPCPHGKCLPCPGGPDHPFQSPQSYTGEEPAALRARLHGYDPYRQVQSRLEQFEQLGHHVDKVELIVMGGTITARPPEYQEWFVASCVKAMNEYRGHPAPEGAGPATLFRGNEYAAVRCVATTFETRPDWCGTGEISRMLSLGVTKVELGVQHIDDAILAFNRRGCTTEDTVTANRLLRDAGLKVGFHVMPNLPGSTPGQDCRLFEELFRNPSFRPDFLKIYPTLVTPGSEIEQLWEEGRYSPYDEDTLIDLIAYGKSLLPDYVRLQRIQRDIPAKLIVAGSRHSNFRQLCQQRLSSWNKRCRCIRCREAGRFPAGGPAELRWDGYDCAGGREHFISAVSGDALVGFARLRTGGLRWRDEVREAALLRELHVYGSIVPLGMAPLPDQRQHRRTGRELLGLAEDIAAGAGYREVAVMSGIGVRPYYRRQGYERRGPYMIKDLG